MQLKTLAKNGKIVLRNYDEKDCRRIFIERNSYVIEKIHCWGDDYGGSQCEDERAVSYEEIANEQILVEDGHFCGAVLLLHYDYCNGGSMEYFEDSILFTDRPSRGKTRSGSSFSNDDHSRWDYTDYYLVERPKDMD